MIKKHQLNIIVFGVILVLSIFMFGSNFQAKFSVIDDHNIVSLVGNDNNFSKNDVLSFLKNEQDFQIGSYGRFRPSFQVGRAIEMYLFEDNALYYQIARFSLFVSLVFIFSVFIIQKVGVLYGSIISLILISESAWRDIFTRIITSEIYTIYGLVVFIPASIGIFNVIKNNVEYKSKIKLFTVAILYFVFGLLSIGSKENFIFMIVVPIVILFWSYKSNNTDFFNRLINLISIVLIGYGLFIATVMVMYFINTNDDVTGYGLFTGGETLIKIAYNFIEMFFINWMAVLLIFPYLFLLVIKGNDKYDRIKKWSLQLYIYIFLLSLLLIFQVIYYTGSLPTGTRYDFPSIFFYSLYLILIVVFAEKVLPIFICNKRYVKLAILIPLILVFIAKNPIEGIIKTSDASYAHKERTKEFQSIIDNVVSVADREPTSAIIVNSFNVWDYELISSFYKYIRYRGIENPIYLKLYYEASNYSTSVEHIFVKRLDSVSNGAGLINNLGWSPPDPIREWGYNPITEFNENSLECIAINIVKSNVNQCATTIVFKYNGP